MVLMLNGGDKGSRGSGDEHQKKKKKIKNKHCGR